MAKKTYREKLADDKDFPKIEEIPEKLAATWGVGNFVIVRPRDVDAVMKKIGKGKVTTTSAIRLHLAKEHGCTTTCPLTTGIFASIAAHAAEEDRAEGKTRITPYWRTLKSDGELNPKFPGGIDGLANLLKSEGHEIVRRGKRAFVKDYESKLESL